ncbi:MAG: hypothetical protein IT376_17990 [Polyangiaceae bacterium]|nr:hypothetical protein [Polyangiaceae bacterium]
MRAKYGALANDPVADEAANDFLLSGGSAVGAVAAGFFAASGAAAGVLLGPLSALVVGLGAGARAFDGRLRQPGLGVRRLRAAKASEPVPDAARVAVPTAVQALVVALGYDGGQKLGTVLRAGIARAQRAGAPARAEALQRVRELGGGAIASSHFVRPFLRVAGPSQGGLLTPQDFAAIPEIDSQAETVGDAIEVPWAAAADEPAGDAGPGVGCAVIAVDVRGVFAAVAYRRVVDGFFLDELDLEAPLVQLGPEGTAKAKRQARGAARPSPGDRLPAAAPVAVRCDAEGRAVAVVATPSARRAGAGSPTLTLRRDPSTGAVESARG